MANFPTSLPGAKTDFDSDTVIASSLQNAQGEEINAIGAKVGPGTDDNTPAENKLLRGTGAGTSEWDKDCPTGDIVGTSDEQTLTNKTLTTPKIDTINEKTTDAGVTIDGVTLKDGVVEGIGSWDIIHKIDTYGWVANYTDTDYGNMLNTDGKPWGTAILIKKPTGKTLYIRFIARGVCTDAKDFYLKFSGFTHAEISFSGTGGAASYDSDWVEITSNHNDGDTVNGVLQAKVDAGATLTLSTRLVMYVKYDD